jgi:hypothetical protein
MGYNTEAAVGGKATTKKAEDGDVFEAAFTIVSFVGSINSGEFVDNRFIIFIKVLLRNELI